MPTNSILEDVLAGNFSEENYPNLTKKDIIKHLLDDLLLLCNGEHIFLRKGLVHDKCFKSDAKEPKIKKYLQDNLDNGKLKNLINFLAQKIGEYQLSEEETKKLISFGKHYNAIYDEKIKLPNSKFAKIDIQTAVSFINFLTRLFNHSNLEELNEIEILAANTVELSENLILNINSNYTNEDLLELLKNLGNLGFELKIKDFQDLSPKIQEIAYNTIHSSNFNSTEAKELAGYTFLSGFHAGSTSEIESDCQTFLALEKCPKPITANNQLFQKIIQGNYINQKPPFSDFEQVKNEINQNLNSLDRPSQFHSFTFLKNILKNNSKSEFDFKLLYRFVFIGLDKLKKDLELQNNLDHSFTQATESLSFFLFNIIKINANNQDLYDQIHIIKEFSQFYKKIINHAPQLNSLLNTLYKHLFNILDRNIDSELALQTGFHEFLTIIKDLNKLCRGTGNCENLKIKILARSFKSLGSISRKSSGYNLNATSEAQELIKLTGSNLNSRQLSDAISYFFKANISKSDIDEQCEKIFNISGCRPSKLINLDDPVTEIEEIISTLPPEKYLKEINISSKVSTPITTTSIPETTTNRTITNPVTTMTAATTIPTVIPLRLNESVIAINTTTEASTTTIELPVNVNSTSSNQTVVDTANINHDTNLANSSLTLGASAAHGVGSGLFNIITQGTSMWLSNKGYGKSALSAFSLSLAGGILQASYTATFPLMLLTLNTLVAEGKEDEAQAQWEIMTKEKMLPIFLTSLGISTVLQLANYLSKNYLPKQSIVKGLVQSIPTASSLWSVYQDPIPTVTNVATSSAVSFFGLTALNRFFSARNQRQCDINTKVKYDAITKECAVELQPLNEEKTSENETNKKTYQFICLPELDKVKNSSKNNLDQLEKLIKTLNENIQTYELQKEKTNTSGISDALEKSIKDNTYILNILKRQFKSANVLCNELTDDMHLKACEMYTLKRKKDFVSAMEKLGNVFKLMETDLKTLQGEIKAAIGYAEAASANFSDEVKKQLKEFSESIIFPLSQVTLYKDRYSNADAVEKTEKRCKAEANQGVFNALIQADPFIIKRTPTHKEFYNANRNTFAFSRSSGSDSDLRTSTASSSGESELSMTSGNSAHNPIVPQQTAPLLRSFRT